jgi:hypothetical protein
VSASDPVAPRPSGDDGEPAADRRIEVRKTDTHQAAATKRVRKKAVRRKAGAGTTAKKATAKKTATKKASAKKAVSRKAVAKKAVAKKAAPKKANPPVANGDRKAVDKDNENNTRTRRGIRLKAPDNLSDDGLG